MPPHGSIRLTRFAAGLAAAAVVLAATTLAARVEAQQIQRVTSPSGITAWLVESRSAPLITVKIKFKGGALQDPPDKPGVATLMAYSFNEGAGEMKSQEFLKRRDRIGAHIGAAADMETVTVNFSTATQHMEEAFELLALAMAQPRFDEDALAISKNAYLNNYGAWLRNPASIGSRALNRLLLGNHRMSVPAEDYLAALKTISTDDLHTSRRKLLARDNALIGVTGDIDAATLGRWLDRLFAGLPPKAELMPETAPTYPGPKRQLLDLDVPQTLVMFGSLAPALSIRELIVNHLLSNVLNAGMTGRLFTEVREKRGLVYSVSVSYGLSRVGESFTGEFGSSHQTATAALDATLNVLRRFAEEGPTEEEMATYKSAAPGEYLFGIESSEGLAARLAEFQLRELPIEFMSKYVTMLQEVTTAEVRDLARKLIKPDQFSIVVVGRPDPPVPMQ
jgi:zinc protease